MPLLSALIVAAGVGVGQEAASDLASAAAAPLAAHTVAEPAVPQVTFEIRELSMGSPDWRGALQPDLRPVARDEGVAAWAVDREGMRRLMEACQSDRDSSLVMAPKMSARLGEPVRMTNEEKVDYVAHLKVLAQGPPENRTSVAFQPEVAEIHEGVRVVLTETQKKGPMLQAHVVVQSTTILDMLTTYCSQSAGPAEPDPGVERASFFPKLKDDSPKRATVRGTIQVPEVATRRIEGDWLIPSDGAIVVSMGPLSDLKVDRKPKPGEKAGGLGLSLPGRPEKRRYFERVVCITARLDPAPAGSAQAPQP
ncbi:MAG: hypothetical protein BGO49_08890 [Planctomycetales bacterium 71-10]|nr:MAG: hypothetical protein BGO49_08890 [Planctomycetales bacterium 71-10]